MTTSPGAPPRTQTYDVAIVGGGMVGMTLAAALGGAGLAVVLLDAQGEREVVDPRFDGRSSAIAWGCRRALGCVGAWNGMAAEAQPIWHIRISDGDGTGRVSRLFLDYDARDVAGRTSWPSRPGIGDEDGFLSADLGAGELTPLGYIIENRVTREALLARLSELPSVRHMRPVRVAQVERGPAQALLQLADGTRMAASLVVAADGGDSPLRAEAGIAVSRHNYPQTAIVCTITHTLPHNGVAHEHFLPAGPFAVLPMVDAPGTDGSPGAHRSSAHRSSIVWTERTHLVPAILQLDDAHFSFEMQRRFGDSLGTISVLGRRWTYPLRLIQAERVVDHRLALVGDAAHVVHPIAGQGLNLGLKDVAALAEVVVDAARLGLDIGSTATLERYARWRRLDTFLLTVATDGINRLFSNRSGPLRLARDFGLAAVDRLPPLKRLFIRDAMGTLGELPRLIRGESL